MSKGEISPRERVQLALTHQEADRVPVDAELSRLEAIPSLVEQACSG